MAHGVLIICRKRTCADGRHRSHSQYRHLHHSCYKKKQGSKPSSASACNQAIVIGVSANRDAPHATAGGCSRRTDRASSPVMVDMHAGEVLRSVCISQ